MNLSQNELEKLNNVTSFDIEYTWKIINFKQKFSDEKIDLKSSMFSSDDHDIQFQLELNKTKKKEIYLNLSLKCLPGENVNSNVPITATFSILDTEGNAKNQTEVFHNYYNFFGHGSPLFCKYSFVETPTNNILNENNELHIFCKARVNYIKTNEFILRQKAFLSNGKNSDVTIVVENTEILAHKAILSAHSPVFETMFSYNDTKEAQEHKLDIKDVEIEIFKKFLLFIYTGIKPKVDFKKTLIIAEKYQVNELKLYCENCILLFLKNKNVIRLYQFADLHNAQKLKENCLSLIVTNFSEIVKTKDWEKFCEIATTEEIVKVTREFSEMKISKK